MAATASTSAAPRLSARHYLAYAAVCFLLGSNWPAVRVLVRDIPPLRAAGLGYVVASAITLVSGWRSRTLGPRNRTDWFKLVVMGVSLLAAPTAIISWAEQYINASLTSVIYAALPLAVALISRATTGHRVGFRSVLAMIIGGLGIIVLFFDGVPHTPMGRIAALGVAASMFVCAWGVVYASNAPPHLSSTFSIGRQLGTNAILVLAVSAVLEHGRVSHWNATSLAAFFFISIFCTAVLVLLYYWLLRRIATFQVATIDLVVPVVAFLEGVFFLHETVTAVMVMAAMVVLASTAYVLRHSPADPASA